MTDRQRQLIEAYIPNPRDPELDVYDYYYENDAGKIFKVYITDIYSHADYTSYGCRYSHNNQRVHTFREWDGVLMHELYDNKEDCKNHEHFMYDAWEELRRLQQEEQQ